MFVQSVVDSMTTANRTGLAFTGNVSIRAITPILVESMPSAQQLVTGRDAHVLQDLRATLTFNALQS